MALTSVVLPTPGPPVMTSDAAGEGLLQGGSLAGRQILAGLAAGTRPAAFSKSMGG